MSSITVDFTKEKEAGYQRIFKRSPVYSSAAVNWEGLCVAYDYMPPGSTPECSSRQHGMVIFVDFPHPVRAERKIDGKFRSEVVTQGDLVVVPAQAWQQAAWNAPGGVIVVGLEPTELARTGYELSGCDRLEIIPHFATRDPLVYQLGLALKSAFENCAIANRLYAESMTNALAVHLLQYYSTKQPQISTYSGGLSAWKLQQVTNYIDTYLERNLSLGELSALVQMSPHYFCQLFKQSTGLSPHQYLIHRRIERAKELLSDNQQAIADVAKAVGFADQSHFHRHFKRLTKVTPKVFLKQN